ncbi:MAG: biopolymer transporter ExbD [Planctomycetia bacterium]|nr:biopolymer transporter ExbD [Planctomycetia bacterium]
MRKRRHRVKAESASGGEFSSTSVFVTPMLDMAFQILAFFVFTYNPSAIEGQFPINLAQAEVGGEDKAPKPEDKVAPDQPTELKSTLFIEVRAMEGGRLSSIKVGTTDVKPDDTEPDKTEALINGLTRELLELKNRNPTEDRITIKGTPTLRWEIMMRVIDAARRNFNPQTKERRDLFPRVSLGAIEQ